ncbi:uncharacterized protein N7458_001544 [Penicillium daleae]|uniref:Uncharacterized protein n=2 Tax=Penicillium TaxID=5073 RepID=A0AAD6CDH5_9EURO|nr:uncharacterized protein N7458_001544 [Penicillium daleae]KAJ5459992.1 hypothetical protein N7458_001544 [Penicillium daleae]
MPGNYELQQRPSRASANDSRRREWTGPLVSGSREGAEDGVVEKEKGVRAIQKLSTNGGLWTLLPVRFMLWTNDVISLPPPKLVFLRNVPAPRAFTMANLPNLRRLFVEARTEVEENEYSRTAFYNLVLFISSVAVFSLAAQRMSGHKAAR